MVPSRQNITIKPRKTLRNVIIGLALLGAGAVAYAGYLLHQADKALENMSVAPPVKTTQQGLNSLVAPAENFKPMTFLLTGIDSRQGSGGTLNTDVLMLVSLNPETRSATVVSIPRDLEMKPREFGLPSQKANYYYAYYYIQDKDTAIQKTKELYGDMFNVPIDYMAAIDFDGFRNVVDELGGIEMNVDMDMRYVDEEDGTDINLKKGFQTLNGKQTLDFLRYRKSNRGTEESSDLARNQRQQEVLDKLLQKMTSFNGIAQWGGLLKIAGESVKTDIPADELRRFLLSFQKLKPDHIEFIHLDGRWDSPYIVVKEDELTAAIAALRTQRGLPAEIPGTTVTGSTYSVYSKRFGIDPAPLKIKETSTTTNKNSRSR
ncbi:LCP family protein [Paenibacillus ehimensis]|uniref:LCP family protein n=1 Tax=Paenibacillus ehimensis TaxID=79264 RepID=A0ABT8VBW7_9BACL|nr:LCP family protein [Paenibacillus ehimensis]MDO3678477.1 LCP family protein [Paenibacillus ehimensis]MEC0213972.1 LCP family protein [Paenibacillus ehimensis]